MSPKQVEWIVKDIDACMTSNPGNWFFQIWATERLYGTKKASEPGGGHFTKIEHVDDFIFGQPEFTWEKTGATVAYERSTARSTISGKIKRNNYAWYLVYGENHYFNFSSEF